MLHCPDCGRDKSVLATDGATPMCAECPGASGDGVEQRDGVWCWVIDYRRA